MTGTSALPRNVMPQRHVARSWTAIRTSRRSPTTTLISVSTSVRRFWHGWQERAREPIRRILDADKESQERFSRPWQRHRPGLQSRDPAACNSRDKYTQILWGVRDFEFRFGRAPEGMWLPETAVDLETLEILRTAAFASRSCRLIRPNGRVKYGGARGGRERRRKSIHRCRIGPAAIGQTISVFFYDGPISQAIAFEHCSTKARISRTSDRRRFPMRGLAPIVHIATDGETYGHHHQQGDMALAYAFHHIEKQRSRETHQLWRIPRTTPADA